MCDWDCAKLNIGCDCRLCKVKHWMRLIYAKLNTGCDGRFMQS